MSQFSAAKYEIRTDDGRHIRGRLFKTEDEIFDFVRKLAVGTYHVSKELPRELGERKSEFWACVTNVGGGQIDRSWTEPVARSG
jgi:hypothetical protein